MTDTIRDLALHCEAKKIGYRQSKDGVVVSFVLHHADVPEALAIADLGTRYMLALVEIGDDETPVNRKEVVPDTKGSRKPETQPRPSTDALYVSTGGAKKSWDQLARPQQAGILCGEPAFWTFLQERFDIYIVDDDPTATLRKMLGIDSRADLARDERAATLFDVITSQYRTWMREAEIVPSPAREEVG